MFALFAVVGLLMGTVPSLAAQPTPWEARFVMSPDGACWVVLGSLRYRLQAAPISAEELAQFTEGSAVASVDQLVALLTAAPPIGSPPPAAPLPSPPASLIGKTARICANGQPINLTVVEAEWARTLNGRDASGMWLIVVATATNTGSRSEALTRAVQVRDERGRTWRDVEGTASASAVDYQGIGVQRGAQLARSLLQPNQTTRVVLVFDVAADATALELVSAAGGC